MNAVSTQVHQGGIAGAEWLTPATMTEGMELSKLMADCTLVPDHLKNKPGDCFPILVQALRWKMDPFAVAQCTAVVRGKLCYEGKLVHAVLISMGAIEGRLSYEYSGEGQRRTIKVTGVPRGGKAASVVGNVGQWATQNDAWKKDPDMMLAYRGTRTWARLHCPDAMLGVYTPDEIDPDHLRAAEYSVVEPAFPEPARTVDAAIVDQDQAENIQAEDPEKSVQKAEKSTASRAAAPRKQGEEMHPARLAANELFIALKKTAAQGGTEKSYPMEVMVRLSRLHGANSPKEIPDSAMESLARDVQALREVAGDLAEVEEILVDWEGAQTQQE